MALSAATRARDGAPAERVMVGRQSIPVSVVLGAVVVGAAALRASIRLAAGEQLFLNDGYTFYADIANNFLAGEGVCYAPDSGCAIRMPVYPLFVAALLNTSGLFPALVLIQSIIGGAIAALAWWIGRELFDTRVGLVAAIAVAINPYAVIHDTSMQDTVLLNALVAAAIALVLRSQRTPATLVSVAAGFALALAVLTSARIGLLVPCVLAWSLAGTGAWADRVRRTALIAAPVLVLTGAWMWRNQLVVGAPVLTTEGGEALFFGNSELTFLHYPDRSIDLIADETDGVPPPVYETLERLQGRDVERDALYRDLAVDYIRSHPGEVLAGAAWKLWIVASGRLSPARDALTQLVYQVTFAAIHALAIAGAWRARTVRQRGHALIALLFLSFALTTAVFWAHTSHKSYLDPFLFIYAASVLPMVKRA
jgi:4-amino-4-deoxy-L-arabinose transferase-like glycosyltransferase